MSPLRLWLFLPVGYLLTVTIETPILIAGLSSRHSFRRRVLSGIWLNACSYPVVVLVLPVLMAGASRGQYLVVAEVFAPVSECALFWIAFDRQEGSISSLRDFAVIVAANLASFLTGELLYSFRWFGPV